MFFQRFVESLQHHSGITDGQPATGINGTDRVHPAQGQDDRLSCFIRGGTADHAAIAPLRDDGDCMSVGDFDNGGHLFGRGGRNQCHCLAGIAAAPIGKPWLHIAGISGKTPGPDNFGHGLQPIRHFRHTCSCLLNALVTI